MPYIEGNFCLRDHSVSDVMFTINAKLELLGFDILELSLVQDVVTLKFNQRIMVQLKCQHQGRKLPLYVLTTFDRTRKKGNKPNGVKAIKADTSVDALMRVLLVLYSEQVQAYTIEKLKTL